MRDALAPGLQALRTHWPPIVLIHFSAATMVILYYRLEWLQQAAKGVEAWKGAGGSWFAFASGAFAGGLLPEVAKILTGRIRRVTRPWVSIVLWTALVYGTIAVTVDFLYTGLGVMFGTDISLATLTKKIAVDMFLYSPTVGIPLAIVMFDAYRAGFREDRMRRIFCRTWYRDRVLPGLVPAWFYWMPLLFCVYALPPRLQFPFAMLAEAAWSILFVIIATRDDVEVVPAVA